MAYMRQGGLFEASGIGAVARRPYRLPVRRAGVGDYEKTGDWTWEYYPPPYDFLAPADSVAMPAPILFTPMSRSAHGGLGDCGCGGSCGGCGGCSHGMGLFDSGFDVSQWGTGEWIAAGVGFYLVTKILGDLSSGSKRVKRAVRSRSSKARRKRELKEELAGL